MKFQKLERQLEARIPTDKQTLAFLKLYNTAQQMKDIDEDLATDLFSSLIEQLDLRGLSLSSFFSKVESLTDPLYLINNNR